MSSAVVHLVSERQDIRNVTDKNTGETVELDAGVIYSVPYGVEWQDIVEYVENITGASIDPTYGTIYPDFMRVSGVVYDITIEYQDKEGNFHRVTPV